MGVALVDQKHYNVQHNQVWSSQLRRSRQAPINASIVIVDDVPENLELLSEILSEYSAFVRTAGGGAEALDIILADPPDLVMLDVMMPDIDGYQVCEELKANKATADVPIIFITALHEAVDKVRAFSLGAADYVTKPFQVDEVIARISAHLALSRSKIQLREQVAELDAFAHTVAHNLKNPLGAIATYLDMVTHPGDTPLSQEQTVELLSYVQQSASKANSIVDELLLLSSVRKQDVVPHVVDMADIIEQAKGRLAAMANKYNTQIIEPSSWPMVIGYAPWIVEVWVNYLSNGMKYGGEPPILELGTTLQEDGFIRFWVHDNGIGLTESEQALLFTEFTRLEELRADGHGLGLSIVRRIITKLKGTVGVESTVGQGSTFYFTLPAA